MTRIQQITELESRLLRALRHAENHNAQHERYREQIRAIYAELAPLLLNRQTEIKLTIQPRHIPRTT